ncbi:YaiI/YqxD family protein [Caulobacter sp. CCUG 60055]|uniref:YaiI/YqxD family protein n=1 Tax=Caulobacter sp. CCUG 60055 TaxID=2100090 RepID=UPI001FA6D424|nr:YaiI/YqxD family protein [Caulobacter sp. CCUG 60055]MBQ1542927.1 YaiI/YqxD family protein [Caulobacteraceae bacterium]MCI3181203.1 YaiI/YqxD family protein [Caulobacter sp. CCUG 60055]
MSDAARKPIEIFIDADACPVKDEAYKVAARYGLKTWVVANAFMTIPASPLIERVVVEAGPDVADDWIAEHVAPGDVVVTNDIPLAERTLNAGGAAIAPNGRPFTRDSIGSAIAQRALMEQLRSTGDILGGPKPFDRNDRSRFLQALDEAIVRERRKSGR